VGYRDGERKMNESMGNVGGVTERTIKCERKMKTEKTNERVIE